MLEVPPHLGSEVFTVSKIKAFITFNRVAEENRFIFLYYPFIDSGDRIPV